MRNFILFIFLSFFIACNPNATIEENDTFTLSGTIKNVEKVDSIRVRGFNFDEKIAFQDSVFSSELDLNTGFYQVFVGDNRFRMYFDKDAGANMTINADAKDFKNSLSFDGNSKAANSYLQDKAKGVDTLYANVMENLKVGETEFLDRIKTKEEKTLAFLNSSPVAEVFKQSETKNIQYKTVYDINTYIQYHAKYSDEKDYVASDAIKTFINNVNWDSGDDLNTSPNYRSALSDNFSNFIYKDYKEGETDVHARFFEYIGGKQNQDIKNYVVKEFFNYVMSIGDERNDDTYAKLVEISSDDEFKKKMAKKYSKMQSLAAGQNSPTFTNYENHSGGTTSLGDLKGKYVYIDVWATWCGPCKREIPHLKEVEAKYHDKDIEFVSISIDRKKDHETWTNMVKDEELKGVQLFADNDWNSQFVKDYLINGIPRFILLDKEGKIIRADAPRPSNEQLTEIIDGLEL